MSLKIIHDLPTGVWIDDRSKPVIAHPLGVFKSIRDSSMCLKLPVDAISDHADKRATVKVKGHGSIAFRWPTANFLKRHPDFAGYRIVGPAAPGAPPLAKPCTVHLHVTSNGRKEVIPFHYRTMTACRMVWNLTVQQFEKIASGSPGATSHMPTCVIGITVHPPSWTPPKSGFRKPGNNTPLFNFSLLKKKRVKMSLISNPKLTVIYPGLVDVPEAFLQHGQWI